MDSDSTNSGEAETTPPAEKRGSSKQPRRVLRALISVGIGVALVGLLQTLVATDDHQNANMATALIGLVVWLYATTQLHKAASQRGYRRLVPIMTVATFVAIGVTFRLDGFSGEMVPQIKLRFASRSPKLRSISGQPSSPTVETAGPSALAEEDSTGFLGNDRTAVIEKRRFEVPATESQVETLWNQGIGQGWSSFAVAGDRAVTLEQRDEMECVTCYRLSDGELLWMQSHEKRHQNALGGIGPRSTPTIEGDRVYAQGATGRVWCLELASGEVQWTVDLLELAGWDQAESEAAISWGRAGSPLIVDGLCIIGYGGPEDSSSSGRSLIAFDKESGSVGWTAGSEQISYASPGLMTLGGKRQIVSVNEKTISGHTVASGEQLWEFPWFGESNGGANCAMAMPAGEDQFLIGKGYGGGSALVEVQQNDSGGFEVEEIWLSNRLLKTKFTHACILDGVAYAISNGSMEAVDLQNEQLLWRQPRGSRVGQGQMVVIEDTIIAQAESGEVVFIALDASEYRELLRLPSLDSKTWNVPTIAGRHLLVRNDRQVICYLLPARE